MAPAPGCHLWSGSCMEVVEADPGVLLSRGELGHWARRQLVCHRGNAKESQKRDVFVKFSTAKFYFLFLPPAVYSLGSYCTGCTRDEGSAPSPMKAEHLQIITNYFVQQILFFPSLHKHVFFIVWTHGYLYVDDVPYDLVFWLKWLQPWSLGALGSCL